MYPEDVVGKIPLTLKESMTVIIPGGSAGHLKIGNRIYFCNMASFQLKQARQCMDNVTLWCVPVMFIPPWLS
jgi:hypothetical protein